MPVQGVVAVPASWNEGPGPIRPSFLKMIIIRRMSVRTIPPRVNSRAAVPILLGLVLPVVCVVSLGVGQFSASPVDVVAAILARPVGDAAVDPNLTAIVWQLRLPRILVGACAGAVLAVGGACLQAVVRNDLADPYLLGVSSGASLGAALVLATGLGAGTALTATGGAFLGALGALALVMALAGGGRHLSGSRLVLAGLTAGYFLTAATDLVVVLSDSRDAVRAVLFWMLGSLGRARWQDVPVLAVATALSLGYLVLQGRRLDAVGMGDDVARSLGVDPFRLRRRATAVAALGVAAAVAVSGAIGFVGLVVPHLARRLVGATHRMLLPTAAVLGALVLVTADALARTVLAPREIPLGILTALVGTPMLMTMLRRRDLRPQ